MKKVLLAGGLAFSLLSLVGCGSNTVTNVEYVETQGKQLMDLKEAYDKGVITEKEYERTKKDILRGN